MILLTFIFVLWFFVGLIPLVGNNPPSPPWKAWTYVLLCTGPIGLAITLVAFLLCWTHVGIKKLLNIQSE